MGLVKDQVSLGRAMTKQGQLAQINIAVLRATSHDEQIAEEQTIRSSLEAGGGSRMRVSYCICVIMDRLNKTHTWVVALKCLLLIHRCLHEGGFMFQDQLSMHPSSGGRNYLNLSKFKDTSSPFTWAASAWVRWYAGYIEQWIQTSRNIGSFLDIKKEDKPSRVEKLMVLASSQLVTEIISLYDFLHEASGWQAEEFVMDHFIVKEGLRLVTVTTMNAYKELRLRFQEVSERIVTLACAEALDLLHVCERLSEDFMPLTYLFATGEDLQPQCERANYARILHTDYEILKLKESLKFASIHNMLVTTPGQLLTNYGFSQQWNSTRWEKSSLSIIDTRRGKSFSEFTFHEALP